MNHHLDFETYSEADLKSVGVYRYARDPSCEVLCLAVSRGHEKPLLWVPPAYQHQLSFIDPMEQMEAQEMLVEMMAKVCRGTRDLQLRYFTSLGLLKEPTDAEWSRALKPHDKNLPLCPL